MWIVNSRTGRKEVRLNAASALAIKAWWVNQATEAQSKEALQAISALHAKNEWLGCDCVHGDDLPSLSPAKRDQTYFLRRLTSRATHARTCPFNFDQILADRQNHANDQSGIGQLGAAPDFSPEKKSKSLSPRAFAERPQASQSRSAGVPAIAKRLWWLMQSSDNQVAPLSNPIPSLMRIAQKVPFGKSGMTLKDALFYGPRAIEEGWLDACLRKQLKYDTKPTCWVLIEILKANIEEKTITSMGWNSEAMSTYAVDGPLRIWAADVSPARFPMLALARVETDGDSKRIAEIYAHPIYRSGNWLLLDSNHERNTLTDLISVGKWLQNEKSIRSSIEKPLFDWLGTGEKPDFVMTLYKADGSEHHCVIETMGFDDSDYINRKENLRHKLIRHSEVIMDYRAHNINASKDLKSAIARWAIRTNGSALAE